MLMPKKVKYRKWMKGRRRKSGVSTTRTTLAFGSYGLKALSRAWISSRQIEASRRVLSRYTKKGGKVWIRIFPDKPITIKGAEMPMGKGKGAVDHYVSVVDPGTIIFEIDGIPGKDAKDALLAASYKLPVRSKVISNE